MKNKILPILLYSAAWTLFGITGISAVKFVSYDLPRLMQSSRSKLESPVLSPELPVQDTFKYFPEGAYIIRIDADLDGIKESFWWDKNHDGDIQKESEIFIDNDYDGVPELTYKEFMNLLKCQEIHESIYSNESNT